MPRGFDYVILDRSRELRQSSDREAYIAILSHCLEIYRFDAKCSRGNARKLLFLAIIQIPSGRETRTPPVYNIFLYRMVNR